MKMQRIARIMVMIALSISYIYAAGEAPLASAKPNRSQKDFAQAKKSMLANLYARIKGLHSKQVALVKRTEIQKDRMFAIQAQAETELAAIEQEKRKLQALANRIQMPDQIAAPASSITSPVAMPVGQTMPNRPTLSAPEEAVGPSSVSESPKD